MSKSVKCSYCDKVFVETQVARRLERERDAAVALLRDLAGVDRVLFKHPGTAKQGTEWRQCRYCGDAWELGSQEQHGPLCGVKDARAFLSTLDRKGA